MEHKDRIVTVAIITGVVALLLGCCLGAMFGVMGGYFIGHQAASRPVERIMPDPRRRSRKCLGYWASKAH